MSASNLGWCFQQMQEKNLQTSTRLVLLCLNEHTAIGRHGDWRVFPSQERIARMAGISRRQVIRCLKELAEAELLVISQQYDANGRQLPNLYWLMAPKIFGDAKDCDTESHLGATSSHTRVRHDVTGECDTMAHNPRNIEPLNKKTYIPYQEVVDLYHSLLPNLPACRVLNNTRKGRIKSLHNNKDLFNGELSAWSDYFAYVANTEWMHGSNDKNWTADIDFLLRENTVIKCLEGTYNQRSKR